MSFLANSEDPDEMPHNAAFHQGLHCLLCHEQLQRKNNIFNVKIRTCDPSVYTTEHPKFIAANQKEESIRAYKVLMRVHSLKNILINFDEV